MQTFAVVQVGGKQYVVAEGDQILVENINQDTNTTIELPALLTFDADAKKVELGAPELKGKVTAEIVEHMKGDKVRIAKFKSKVRYRKVMGFRAQLTKLKITKI